MEVSTQACKQLFPTEVAPGKYLDHLSPLPGPSRPHTLIFNGTSHPQRVISQKKNQQKLWKISRTDTFCKLKKSKNSNNFYGSHQRHKTTILVTARDMLFFGVHSKSSYPSNWTALLHNCHRYLMLSMSLIRGIKRGTKIYTLYFDNIYHIVKWFAKINNLLGLVASCFWLSSGLRLLLARSTRS